MTKETKADKAVKPNKKDEQIQELTTDLQRVQADFENYRKRVELEKEYAKKSGAEKTILDLLPVIDNIDRAITHVPKEIADNSWVKGVTGLTKQLDKALDKLSVSRIEAKPGTAFDPDFHQAIQFDEDAQGDTEVIVEELQSGYAKDKSPIRHSMVRVTRK